MKLIATGDMHLDGGKTPMCRTDDYYQAQVNKLQFIKELKEEYNAIHIDAGDILDRAVGKSPTEAIKTIELVLNNIDGMYGILGNHDMKNHSKSMVRESNIWIPIHQGNIIWVDGCLELSNNVFLHGFNFGDKLAHIENKKEGEVHIALYHGFVDEKVNTLIGGLVARDVVKEFGEDYDFIITADHHKPFTFKRKTCTLINTGSLMRTTIKQVDHKPCVWLIDTETKEYEQIFIPIEDASEVITTAHADMEKDRDERIEAFVTYAGNEYEVTNSFEDNMKNYLKEHNEVDTINDNVVKYINESMEGIA